MYTQNTAGIHRVVFLSESTQNKAGFKHSH